MVNNKSKKIVTLVALSIADVDLFQFEFENGAASSSERINLMMRWRRPTLTTEVYFKFDDGDGFFNPASCAFTALRLSAYSLPSIDGDGFFNPASCAFAARRLSAYPLPSIDGDGFFNPAS